MPTEIDRRVSGEWGLKVDGCREFDVSKALRVGERLDESTPGFGFPIT